MCIYLLPPILPFLRCGLSKFLKPNKLLFPKLQRADLGINTSGFTDAQMHEAVAAIASCGVSPIVRIPDNQAWMVKRALDSGAHGIVVPLLCTVDDARKLVQSAKFPPVGQRGFGSPFSMGMFDVQGGMSGLQYLQEANEGLVTVVQIETREAFENVSGPPEHWDWTGLVWSLVVASIQRSLADERVPHARLMRSRRWTELTCCSSDRTISAITWGIR